MTSSATAAPAINSKATQPLPTLPPKVTEQKPSNLAASRRASYMRSKSFEPGIVEITGTKIKITGRSRSKSYDIGLNDAETRLLAFSLQDRPRRTRGTFRRSHSFDHGDRSYDKYERNMKRFQNYLGKIGEIWWFFLFFDFSRIEFENLLAVFEINVVEFTGAQYETMR